MALWTSAVFLMTLWLNLVSEFEGTANHSGYDDSSGSGSGKEVMDCNQMGCLNNGTCDSDTGLCICPSEYEGQYCNIMKCDSECQNGGYCKNNTCECPAHFHGPTCEEVDVSCGKYFCFNGGTCNGDVCICPANYTGQFCLETIYTIECGDMVCFHNATCVNGICVCPNGYTGEGCHMTDCDKSCLNGGICYYGMCHCSQGFYGQYCEFSSECTGPWCEPCHNDSCECPPNATWCHPRPGGGYCQKECLNGGNCYHGVCNCSVGFYGEYCERSVCSDPWCHQEAGGTPDRGCDIECLNGGWCYLDMCFCPYGFTGRRCEIDPGEPCGGHFCYHGASCNHTHHINSSNLMHNISDGVVNGSAMRKDKDYEMGRNDSEVCNCPPLLEGPYCKTPKCPVCENNGTCESGRCRCPPGYGGHRCEQKVQICSNASCHGNQSCTAEEVCECIPGFTGPDCSVEKCDTHCFNGGMCLNGHCHCIRGFGGPYCERRADPCLYYDCHNGGECYEGVCLCPEGFGGLTCEKDLSCSDCPYYGHCHEGSCYCASYIGKNDHCDDYYTMCEGMFPCVNGTCNGSTCVCSPGYTGSYCERNQCDPPCLNGGICNNGRCECDFGISGPQCENTPGEPCGHFYCLFGGSCNRTSEQCTCMPGYGGTYCTERTCVPECKNNGSCHKGYCYCKDGFEGPTCSQEAPRCGLTHCYNGGNCVNGTVCECAPGFNGPNCTEVYCDTYCFNGGTCVNGHCRCHEGFKGEYCEQRVSPCGDLYCYNNAQCVNNTCVCPPGYTGQQCDKDICQNGCPYYGICYRDHCVCPDITKLDGKCDLYYITCPNDIHCINNGTCGNYSCVCPPEYTGLHCEQKSCHPGCLNGGSCHNGHCHCPYGFTGDRCEIPPGEECGGAYCYHTSTCNITSGTCVCPPQLTGPYCNLSTCYPMCENNGICVSEGRNSYCSCPDVYFGSHCQHNIELLRCGYGYCFNNGECVNGSCVCGPEYSGSYCETSLCTAPCQNNGSCENAHCSCPHGYTGLYCELEYEYCRDVFCTNNGRCIHGECVCSPGYTGAGCELEICTDGCPYYGHCVHDKCYCPNYTSQQNECDQYFTLCNFGPPCLNNGTCGTSSCTCAYGYTGLYCEMEVCNINCLNGATCHIDSCECPKGWKGQQCEIREAVTAQPPLVTNPPQVRPCPLEMETSDRGVFEWPQTQVGGVARLPCPCPMNPALTEGIFAVRKCVSSTLWGETDWTACTLSEKTKQLCNVGQEELLTIVKNVTSDTSTLKAGDVALLVSAVDALSTIEDNVNDAETRDNLLNVVDDILSVNSKVLEETSETSDTSEKIVDVFDKIAAKVQLTNGELKVKKDNFVLEVKETTVSDIPEEGFTPDFSAETSNKAVLPKSLFQSLNLSTDDSLRISSSVIDKPTLFKGRDESVTVSSSIISISVVGMTVAGLETPIELTFQKILTNNTLSDSKMTCQFWNVTLDDGLGAWSGDGCYVMEESELNVKCACNHLTGFAIIETQADTSTANQSEDAVVIAFPAAAGGVFIIGIVAVGLVLFAIQWKMRSRRQISNHHHPVDAVIANEYATTTM